MSAARELKISNEESIAFFQTGPCHRLVAAAAQRARRRSRGRAHFRDSRDVDLLETLATGRKRVVVVGGGLLGLEAAYGLAKAGAVTLIHLMDRLMERQLDARRRNYEIACRAARASRSC